MNKRSKLLSKKQSPNKAKKIWFGLLIVFSLFVLIWYYILPELGVLGDFQCSGKVVGSYCGYGKWMDENGLICGGKSCAGLTRGKCFLQECRNW